MKLIEKTVLFLAVAAFACSANRAQPANSNWTGGFWVRGDWVGVSVAFDDRKQGTATVVFPLYNSSTTVPLEQVVVSDNRMSFEIPLTNGKLSFIGQASPETISGDFVYGQTKGKLGITRRANVTVESLEKYYGIYRASRNHFISISRGWSDPRTLILVDYLNGSVRTLWPSSESTFFSHDYRAISYPSTNVVAFTGSGNVQNVSWRSPRGLIKGVKEKVTERRLRFEHDGIRVAGTLILPATIGPHPVCVVTPGDYGTHRNQLRLFAHNYVAQGIAAFIFDSRGAGESTGRIGGNNFDALASDVVAVVEGLKSQPGVNPKQIGLFGFSNSAWTVSLAASQSDDVAFLILQSLAAVTAWKQELFRAETQLRVDGFPPEIVRKGAEFMRLKFDVARGAGDWNRVAKIMRDESAEPWLAYTNPPSSAERLRSRWAGYWNFEPSPTLEKLQIPILAFWGDKDTFVPHEESMRAFRNAMSKAGNTRYVVKVFANGRHDLGQSRSGRTGISAQLKSFVPELWQMQTNWVRRALRGTTRVSRAARVPQADRDSFGRTSSVAVAFDLQ